MILFRCLCSILGLFILNTSFAQTFVNVAPTQGIQALASGNYGNGVSFYDWNQDGFDDITLTNKNVLPRFFQNNQGTFSEIFFDGIVTMGDVKSVNWVDINNDGAPDISFNSYLGKVYLYLNDGNFHFTDISASSHIIQDPIWGYALSWADYNKDGFVDLYVSNYMDSLMVGARTNYLYKNNGDGTFEDVSVSSGTSNGYHYSFQSVWFDYDNDSWVDLFVINDRVINRNYLYHNNGDGTFAERGIESGLGVFIDAMSASVADYNNDGWFDIYISDTPTQGNFFFKNNGDGTFSNVSAINAVQMFQFCWGAVWLDADNDRLQDLFVPTIPYLPVSALGYNSYFKNQGNTFDIQFSTGLSAEFGSTFSCARGDINNDGFFDLLTHSYAPIGTQVWQNTGIGGNYLKVKLEGVISNRDATGVRLELYSGANKQYRYTLNGEQYVSQNSQWQIFGLGSDTHIDSLVIKWPSGWRDVFYQPAINQNFIIREGSSITNQITFSGNVRFCHGDSLVLDGGIWDSYAWSNGSTERFLTVKESGNYTVDIQSNGFTIPADTIAIIVDSLPQVNEIISQPSCFQSNNGSIILEHFSSNSKEVIWSDGQTGLSRDSLTAGDYQFQLTDIHGCVLNDTIHLTQPEILQAYTEFNQDTCLGMWSGSALASGGTPPYVNHWEFMQSVSGVPFLIIEDSAFTCLDASQSIHVEYVISDSLGCTLSGDYDLGIILGLETELNESAIQIFPNPAEAVLIINTKSYPWQVEILDALGRIVRNNILIQSSNSQLDISDLNSGSYVIAFQNSRTRTYRSFIKK